jgi:CRP-like cAMP-binding protein
MGPFCAAHGTVSQCLDRTKFSVALNRVLLASSPCQRPAATQVDFPLLPQGRVMETQPQQMANKMLAGLDPADLARLKPHLAPVLLPVRKQLEARNRPIEHVYFLASGLASVVVSGGSHHTVEVGIIGSEGMTGLAVVMGADRAPHETFIQSAGEGWRIEAAALAQALRESPTLPQRCQLHAFAFITQITFTALANARYRLDERLARWLLMAADRVGLEVTLTHEFLALMMGVRRPGVTSALALLEEQGLVQVRRGVITIRDRARLVEVAKGSYGAPEAELERLLSQR